MIRILTIAVILISASIAEAQEVSKEYERRLKTLYKFSVDTIMPEEAYRMMDDAIFLDTREKEEYKVSHIEDAIYIGYTDPKFGVLFPIPKNKTIILYCSVGYRSEKIGEELKKRGYTNVHNIYGGMFHWVNSGYPVFKKGEETEEVHPYDEAWGKWLEKGKKVYE